MGRQQSPRGRRCGRLPIMSMRVSILTREYPPYIYGGAGVHVGQLVPQLRELCDLVDVQCMGEPREGAVAHAETYPPGANQAVRTLGADVSMAAAIPEVDVIHSHTWCGWMTSTSGIAAAMDTSAPSVRTAWLAPSGYVSACATAPSRGSPMHWTSTRSHSSRSCGTSWPTWTPAPP